MNSCGCSENIMLHFVFCPTRSPSLGWSCFTALARSLSYSGRHRLRIDPTSKQHQERLMLVHDICQAFGLPAGMN
jgi:hypothetical protein